MALPNDLHACVLSKLKKSDDFRDIDLTYSDRLFEWLEDVVKAIIFNSVKLMEERRAVMPNLWQGEEVKQFYEKMEWWAKVVKKLSKSAARRFKWKTVVV